MTSERRIFLVGVLLTILSSGVAGEPELVVTDTPGTFAQSQQACRSRGTEYGLPLYQGQDNIALVQEAMVNNSLSEIWLPLRRKRLPTWTWLDGKKADQEFRGQQLHPNMNCGLFHLRDVIIELDDCTYGHLGYLCETQERCSSLGVSQTNCQSFKNRTLVYGCGINNWYDARYQCRKQNMDLAIIRDQEVKQFLHQTWYVDNKKKCMNVWVGFRRDDWMYDVNKTGLKDDPVFPMYWESKAPSHIEDCVTVFRIKTYNKLYWKTQNCSAKIPGLCIKQQKYRFLQKVQPTEQITPALNSDAGYNPSVAVGVVVTCLIVVGLIIGVVIFMKRKKVKSEKFETDNSYIVRYVITDPCHDREGSPEDETMGIDVDMTGGSLQHRDSGITLDVPYGAVPADEELRISLQTLSDLAFYQSPPKGLIYISPIIKVQMRPVTPLDNFAEISIPHRLPRENIHVYYKDPEQEQWSESKKLSDSREAQNRLHHEVDNDKVRVKFKRVNREGIHIVSTSQANLNNLQLRASIYAARKRSTNGHFRLFTCVYHSMHELPLSLMREQLDGEGDYEEANVNEEQTLLKSGEQYPPETGNPDSIYVHLSPMELFKVNAIQTPTATLEVRSATDNENWRIDQDDPHHSIPVSALLDGLFPWVVVKYRAVPKDGVVDLEEFMVDQIISLKKSDSISPNDEGSPSVKWKFKVPVKKEYVKLSKAHIETEDPLAATDKDMQDGADLVPAASENKNDAATDPTNKDNNKVPVGFPVQEHVVASNAPIEMEALISENTTEKQHGTDSVRMTSVFKQEIASGTQDESDRTPIQVPQVSTIDLHPPKMTTTEGQNQPEEYMDSKEESPSAEERITSIIQDETKDLSPPYSQETLEEIVCTEGRDTTMELVDERPKKSGEKEKVEKKEKKKKKK